MHLRQQYYCNVLSGYTTAKMALDCRQIMRQLCALVGNRRIMSESASGQKLPNRSRKLLEFYTSRLAAWTDDPHTQTGSAATAAATGTPPFVTIYIPPAVIHPLLSLLSSPVPSAHTQFSRFASLATLKTRLPVTGPVRWFLVRLSFICGAACHTNAHVTGTPMRHARKWEGDNDNGK